MKVYSLNSTFKLKLTVFPLIKECIDNINKKYGVCGYPEYYIQPKDQLVCTAQETPGGIPKPKKERKDKNIKSPDPNLKLKLISHATHSKTSKPQFP
jgi:hypothetical protein